MRIPFLKYNIDVTKRGVTAVDQMSGMPVSFDAWLNRFSLAKRTPILENIYDTIATEFSKIDLTLSRETIVEDEDGNNKHTYELMVKHQNYEVLALRPNLLQTKSELLYTIAYQLHMYRNALVRIIRAEGVDRNIVLALEPLNADDYLFGQGYEVGDTLYLKLKEKKTGNILLLDYGDVIHLRLNPNDIFYGDRNDRFDLTSFVKIFDENLSAMLNELKNVGTMKGIIVVGGSVTGSGSFNGVFAKDENKIDKQKEIVNRIKASKGGITVLDSGEKWIPLTREFKTMSTDEVNNLMKYLYNFKGINQAVIDGTATEAQMEVFYNKTIMPIVDRLLEELNYKFLTATARTQGQKIEHYKNPFEYIALKVSRLQGHLIKGMRNKKGQGKACIQGFQN